MSRGGKKVLDSRQTRGPVNLWRKGMRKNLSTGGQVSYSESAEPVLPGGESKEREARSRTCREGVRKRTKS